MSLTRSDARGSGPVLEGELLSAPHIGGEESDAARPVELMDWIPPNGGMVWSVSFLGDLLLVGDINNGLFVLRR